jgi:hypothetical protein
MGVIAAISLLFVGLASQNIRVSDPELQRVVARGYARSQTVRELTDTIAETGWLVFVQAGRCPDKRAVACLLHFVGTFDGRPYLRIVIARRDLHPDNLTALLAHELQHAVEATRDRSVTDAEMLRAVFIRIGYVSVCGTSSRVYETHAAREIGDQVLRELMR